MRKRIVSMLLCGAMLTVSLSGCETSNSTIIKEEHRKTIGISLPTKTLERWNKDGSYLKRQFEEAGYNVLLAYSDNETKKQISDIDNLISRNVDLLIVAAIDGESLSEVLADAKGVDIPVVSYDRLIRNTDAVSYYVSFDNYKVGQLQGEYIEEALDLEHAGTKTYNLEITAGDMADNNAKFFYRGAVDVLQKYMEKGTLQILSGQKDFREVSVSQWEESVAYDRMKSILASYYAVGKKCLDVCLCSNDSTALGVLRAIEMSYRRENIPIITGQDGDEENLKNILDGKQAMTVYKAVSEEVKVTLEVAKNILQDKRPSEELCEKLKHVCDVKYDTESYDNGVLTVPSYLLTPQVVTKDNYKKVLVEAGYYTEDANGYLKHVD